MNQTMRKHNFEKSPIHELFCGGCGRKSSLMVMVQAPSVQEEVGSLISEIMGTRPSVCVVGCRRGVKIKTRTAMAGPLLGRDDCFMQSAMNAETAEKQFYGRAW